MHISSERVRAALIEEHSAAVHDRRVLIEIRRKMVMYNRLMLLEAEKEVRALKLLDADLVISTLREQFDPDAAGPIQDGYRDAFGALSRKLAQHGAEPILEPGKLASGTQE